MNFLKRMFFAFFFILPTTSTPTEPLYTILNKLTPQKELEKKGATKPSGRTNRTAQTTPHALDLSLHVPDEAECRRLYLTILEELPDQPTMSIIEPEVLKKLNLVIGSEKNSSRSVANKFPTTSLFGKTATETLLATPSCSIAQLEQRKELVRFFVENREITEQVKQAAEKIKSGQALFFSYFQTMGDAEKQVFNSFYFSSLMGRLNQSATALEITELLHEFLIAWKLSPWDSSAITINNLVIGITNAYKQSRSTTSWLEKTKNYGVEVGLKAPARALKQVVLDTVMAHNPFPYSTSNAQYDQAGNLAQVTIDPSKGYFSLADAYRIARVNPGLQNSFLGSHAGVLSILALKRIIADVLYAHFISSALSDLATTRAVFENLQTKLIGIARIVEGLEELNHIINDYELNGFQDLTGQIESLLAHKKSSSHIGKLLQLLETSTFKGDVSFISHKGRILAANHFMEEIETKDAFVSALQEAGFIEALCAAAELMTSSKSNAGQFCFVSFEDSSTPLLDLEGFWNILLEPGSAVLNNILLGDKNAINMILTGTNMGGKSILMRAVAINIILAQAFGIAAASKASMTLFNSIRIYLDEKEDIGTSNFMAQKEKFDLICKKLVDSRSQCTFSIIDEPLTGTSESSAGEFVREAGIKLAQLPNSMCVLATHAEEPTHLQELTNGRFANYYIETIANADGSFTTTHLLKPGILEWWIKDFGMRKSFINWLTHSRSTPE
ncbi:TPA: hypothetical protein DDZ86_02115 [Candidatus Dependentiae bacterium]|nr:MAG: hypothetical protein UW09_C0001G0216 [candidate division TM6 bacterium GW2011_GWF2_43_87]HBL98419.1 hypothetical protein [Candidatus Dependentiae bacterium]